MTGVPATVRRWLSSAAPAVIFDFNGTLSNDEPILFDIFGSMFADRLGWQMSAEEYRDELLGHSDREIIEIAVARHGTGDHQIAELLEVRHHEYLHRVTQNNPITGAAVALVERLAHHDIPMAIVTGAQRADVVAVLRSSPAGDHISILVTEEDVRRGKPDPEGFLSAARLLGRQPDDVLVFEDSIPGVRGALAAGMHCIAVGSDPSAELRGLAPAHTAALSEDIVAEGLSRRR